jgi:hypothetical protein
MAHTHAALACERQSQRMRELLAVLGVPHMQWPWQRVAAHDAQMQDTCSTCVAHALSWQRVADELIACSRPQTSQLCAAGI